MRIAIAPKKLAKGSKKGERKVQILKSKLLRKDELFEKNLRRNHFLCENGRKWSLFRKFVGNGKRCFYVEEFGKTEEKIFFYSIEGPKSRAKHL